MAFSLEGFLVVGFACKLAARRAAVNPAFFPPA